WRTRPRARPATKATSSRAASKDDDDSNRVVAGHSPPLIRLTPLEFAAGHSGKDSGGGARRCEGGICWRGGDQVRLRSRRRRLSWGGGDANRTQNQGALVKHEDDGTDVLELEYGGAEAIKLRSSHSTLHAARLDGNIHL
ncbi:hypothetical protein E2562_035213, partial [Oryza meyeriana var. granulata]